MSTVISTPTPYLTVAQFLLYKDSNKVRELVADNGVPAPANTLATHPVLAEMALAASGELDSRCLRGGRYQPADLALIAGSATAAAAQMRRILADWMFWTLAKRRWPRTKREEIAGADDAEAALEALANGETIFGLDVTAQAANAQISDMKTPDIERNGLTTWNAARFFGQRASWDFAARNR